MWACVGVCGRRAKLRLEMQAGKGLGRSCCNYTVSPLLLLLLQVLLLQHLQHLLYLPLPSNNPTITLTVCYILHAVGGLMLSPQSPCCPLATAANSPTQVMTILFANCTCISPFATSRPNDRSIIWCSTVKVNVHLSHVPLSHL